MNHSQRARRTPTVLVFVMLVALAACSTSASGSKVASDPNGATTVAGDKSGGDGGDSGSDDGMAPLPDPDIELADDVVVIPNEIGTTVVAPGKDGNSVLLDGDNPAVADLEVGSVMLLAGVGAGRVTDVATDGFEGDVAVWYESVSLPEVIENGEFALAETEVDLSSAEIVLSEDMAEVSGSAVEPAAHALPTADNPNPSGSKVSGEAGKFKFEFEWKPDKAAGGNLKLTLNPLSDFQGEIVADVTLKPLKLSSKGKVASGEVDFFDLDFENLQGEATITGDLSALKQTAALTTLPFFKLPASISFPVPVAGIPFTLTLSATIQVNLSIALAQNTLHGEAKVSFGGPAGFSYSGGEVSLKGTRTAEAPDLLSKLQGVASGPVGLVFTTELPKVSFGLKILQTGAGVFVSNGMVTSMWIAPAPVLCHRVQVSSVVAGGIDAQFLGASVTFTRKAFLDKRWTFFAPKDDARCDGEDG